MKPSLSWRYRLQKPNKKKRTLPASLQQYIQKGIELELLSPEFREFDLDTLGAALLLKRDQQFTYLGLQTLYDRYFIHHQLRAF